EGIIGLVRAFTYAGAKSVVASQWVTGDQSSAELMIAFYRFLGQGMSRDKALQSARLYLMNNHPDQGHPFFWAGFRLYGG
ncbi:MAG: CHAT domain-containing protein, partial [Saprospiraceae bacterium]|nr:CHAT domain-containing protein [Saprospiraceae bacterium]